MLSSLFSWKQPRVVYSHHYGTWQRFGWCGKSVGGGACSVELRFGPGGMRAGLIGAWIM